MENESKRPNFGRTLTFGEHRLGVDLTRACSTEEERGYEMAYRIKQAAAALVNLISQLPDGNVYDWHTAEYKSTAVQWVEAGTLSACRAATAPLRIESMPQEYYDSLLHSRVESLREVAGDPEKAKSQYLPFMEMYDLIKNLDELVCMGDEQWDAYYSDVLTRKEVWDRTNGARTEDHVPG